MRADHPTLAQGEDAVANSLASGQTLSQWSTEQELKHTPLAKQLSRSPRPPKMHLEMPNIPIATEVTLAALQYLPTPLIVLTSLKSVLLANEAMGRLLGLRAGEDSDNNGGNDATVTDMLKGQTLSQIGVDMMQDGVPVWVSWEKFLDHLVERKTEAGNERQRARKLSVVHSGETTPIATPLSPPNMPEQAANEAQFPPARPLHMVHDTVVDVVVSAQHNSLTSHPFQNGRTGRARSPAHQTLAKMIISIWTLEDQTYFTLSFTSSGPLSTKSHSQSHVVSRPPSTTSHTNGSSSSTHSSNTPISSRSSSAHSSTVTSPTEIQTSSTPFPPFAAPAKCHQPGAFTDFQKVLKMKDAMLSAMEIPVIAMWKDESVTFPNQAARRLLAVEADPTSEESYDFMSRFKAFTDDFTRELEPDEMPFIKLCRTHKPFTKWKIGMLEHRTGKKLSYDVSGRPVFDEKTGDFVAGLVAFKDVTEYREQIASQVEENEQQFQLICNTMPQMLWTTRPDGYHDYFSQRWYEYTGLSVKECLGLGWKLPFHPDDVVESVKKWQHSLETGEEYLTEYRCQRHDGEWRWMLGRALPLRDKEGKILKWFGTCTDIQDIVDARDTAKRLREQLANVMKHAKMIMWTVDSDHRITFYEGLTQTSQDEKVLTQNDCIGKDVQQLLLQTTSKKTASAWMTQIDRILSGRSEIEMFESLEENGRWQRARMIAQKGKRGTSGMVDENAIVGCIGISMDATEVKKKELENVKLLSNEAAAKEASRLKSSFLANMSHEIRTPIAGIIGMSELMMDTTLNDEQTEFAQNIQRSANGLLTVINDILDFSKVESGRLDIEEVQFSLSVVLEDVSKMLSYAAERKGLQFHSDFNTGQITNLLGDPGRLRQILTNLLTNSIKFTKNGYVKMSVEVVSETADVITVDFTVEDTGIGIEEEVKKKLFKPFSQADSSTARRFGGTGLGLTICKNLVELMHGKIQLLSKLDQGTKATFSIPFNKPQFDGSAPTPLVDIGAFPDRLRSELSLSCNESSRNDHASPRAMSAASPADVSSTGAAAATASTSPSFLNNGVDLSEAQRKAFHILVVEDNPINQQIALKTIKKLHFSGSAVWNGREALEYLLKAGSTAYPIPAVILMDVQMPVLDGYRATHILREHSPYKKLDYLQTIPIIALTASAIEGDKEKCQKAGMDDYLAKPVRRANLEHMIIKWLNSDMVQKKISYHATRPHASVSSTEHGSDCLGSEAGGPPEPSKDSELDPSHSTLTRNVSSKKAAMIAPSSAIYSEGDRRDRREEAEEYASALRDDKLLAATSDETFPEGTLPSSPFNLGMQNSIAPRQNYSRKGSNGDVQLLALTEENVGRFNEGQSSNAGPPDIDDPSKLLPSPPEQPNANSAVNGDHDHTASGVGYLRPTTTAAAETSFSSSTATKFSIHNDVKKPRRAWFGRKPSDWSETTAKPGS